jgi:sarcosine oxidase, subunit beta
MTRTADAVVVGAGIAGISTAWHLRRAGLSVLLVDAEGPASGASGRNPGFLWLQSKAAGPTMDLALRLRRFAEDFAHAHGDTSFRACGGLVLWREPEAEAAARAYAADRRAAGLPIELLDRSEVRDLVPEVGPEVSGGVWNPLDAHQASAGFARDLARDFRRLGGTLLAPARVETLTMTGDRCSGIRLADGSEVHGGLTILATGAAPVLSAAGVSIPFRAVAFEAAETAPAPFRLGPAVAGQALFRAFASPAVQALAAPRDRVEARWPDLGFTEQIASMPDGRLQFGCAYRMDATHDRPTVAGQAIAGAVLPRNFPALADLPVERAWAGLVALTPDGLPVVDPAPGPDGLALNLGHFFGNLAGTWSGLALASALLRSEPPDPSLGLLAARRFAS